MKFDPGIIRNYDIRGEYGKDFDDEFAERLGAAVVAQFNAKTLVVARDERPSAVPLVQSIIRGITAAGCDVIDVGVSSTPFFYYVVTNKDTPAGIMVTASHMGEAFNGFKICKHDGMVLAKDYGLPELMKLLPEKLGEGNGNVTTADFRQEHAEVVIKHSQLMPGESKLRISLEAPGMVKEEFQVVADRLNLNIVTESPDITFVFDADGDRVLIKNKNGRIIRGDLYGGLVATRLSKLIPSLEGRQPTIVYEIRYSRSVLEYLTANGISFYPAKIGHTLIKQKMREVDADFCGEGSGHPMFKVMHSVESTILLVLMVLKILAVENMSIDEAIKPMETWYYSGELNTPIEGWPNSVSGILANVEKHYPDAEITKLDGLKVDYPDWWFLLRASSNDPVIRLILEARTKEMMDTKIAELQELIKAPSSV